ncbi:MAG: protein kinase domain-containing protein [Terriglobia bacterium]
MKKCPACEAHYPNRFSVCPQDGAKLVESSGWSDGTVVRGKYRIVAKVGQGGMGAVYKASHVTFDELRALKVMNPDLLSDELFVKRFKQEAIIARKLDHPNAVRVDDLDESEDGLPFMVMEYIEGESLKSVIEKVGPLPAARACSIAKQVAAALDAAHRLGMVHRDIKPANIVLIATPAGEQAKVLDFGIAKLKEAQSGDSGMTLTGTGIVMGTPQYMSPEQALGKRGDQLDGRSDLYSLGVVMYQMLSGELPFKADTTMQLLLAHINTPPRPLLEAKPELKIPPGVARVVMQCLEKDPNHRPADGAALIRELEMAEQGLGGVAMALNDSGADMATMIAAPRASRGGYSDSRQARSAAAQASTGGASAGVATQTPPGSEQPVVPAGPAPPLVPDAKPGRSWALALAVIIILIIAAAAAVWFFRFGPGRTVVQTSPPGAVHAAAKPAIAAPAIATQASASAQTSENPGSQAAPPAPPSQHATGAAAPALVNETPSRATRKVGARRAETAEVLPQKLRNREAQLTQPVSVPAVPAVEHAPAQPTVKNPSQQTALPNSSAEVGNPSLGTAMISSSPGAEIYIDGKKVGAVDSTGKLTVRNLQPGTYTLHASLKGFPDVDAGFRVGVGGIAFPHPIFDTSQTMQTTFVPAKATPAAASAGTQAVAASYPVDYLHRFGSSKGLLVIEGSRVRYQPSDGKDPFSTPVAGLSWRSTGAGEFSITANGKAYRFRSASSATILATLRRAAGAQ